MSKQRINSKFFKQWSFNMAYILGFIVADGSVSKRKNRKNSYYINITNKERKHLERINKAMSSQYGLEWKGRGGSCKKEYSYIQISNKEICKDLKVSHNKFIQNIDTATDEFVDCLNNTKFPYSFLGLSAQM